MRLARIRSGGSTHLARIEGDDAVLLREEPRHPGADVLRDALAASVDLAADGLRSPLADVELLAPVANPSKVIGIGLNYADHAREAGVEPPASPLSFAKTHNTVCGPGDTISWDGSASAQVDYEAELAVVIGREASHVDSDPLSFVLGYTCCNDVSARDVQFADGQWTRGKCFDGFLPVGPWIVTADEIVDPQALRIGCDVNGERLQDGSTGDMIFGVAELISFVSQFMRLLPGDVIATGTPAGVGLGRNPQRFLGNGDEVRVWIEGIGALVNTCAVDVSQPAGGRR